MQHNLDEFKELFETMIYTNSELRNLMASIYSSDIKTSKEYFNETNWSNTKNNILSVIKSIKLFDFFIKFKVFVVIYMVQEIFGVGLDFVVWIKLIVYQIIHNGLLLMIWKWKNLFQIISVYHLKNFDPKHLK